MMPNNMIDFANKALIIPTYASSKKPFYSIEELNDFEELKHCLGEVQSHEADLTRTGIEFLKKQFGLEELAGRLFSDGWFSDEYSSAAEIHAWLQWWEKNATRE